MSTCYISIKLIKLDCLLVFESFKLYTFSRNFSFRYNEVLHCYIICTQIRKFQHRVRALKYAQGTYVPRICPNSKTNSYGEIRNHNIQRSDSMLLDEPTPYNRVHLEKLTVRQLITKSLSFYGTRRFTR